MTTEERIEQLVYSKMCCGCLKEKFCHEECETCEEYDKELYYQLHPTEHIKFKDLELSTKFEIYNAYQSSKFYVKEICTKYHITQNTYAKVVNQVANIIDKKLKTN